VREGSQISDQRYRDALSFIAKGKEEIAAQHRKAPIILVPAATGPAPKGLKSTGNPAMNAPWTALGTPAITIPCRSVAPCLRIYHGSPWSRCTRRADRVPSPFLGMHNRHRADSALS
jgi:Asp-tRNA(Asn)/Glu-tRNA(Gln) amidotransferase A subunit family amidase